MDIKYIRENDIHEKYLLNQLSAEQIAAYEDFIKDNPEAFKEFEDTKNLLSGIRTIGKDTMRREIEEQVREIRHPKTDWTLLYKAAAVLFLFAILPAVVYYNVYVLDIQNQSEEQLRMDSFEHVEGEGSFDKNDSLPIKEKPAIKSQNKKVRSESKKPVLHILKSTDGKPLDANEILSDLPSVGIQSAQSAKGGGTGEVSTSTMERSATGVKAIKDELKQDAITEKNEFSTEAFSGIKAPEPQTNDFLDEIILSDKDKDQEKGIKSEKRKLSMDRSFQSESMSLPVLSKKAKVLEIAKDGKTLSINLVHSFQSEVTDSLHMKVLGDTINYKVEISIPSKLYMINKKEIITDWAGNVVTLKFKDVAAYKFRLGKHEKYARKIPLEK